MALIATTLLLSAAALSAGAKPVNVSASVGCQIRASSNSEGVTLQAIVTTGGAVSGTYVFIVAPTDGSEPDRLEGDFTAAGAGQKTVADLDLPAGSGYRASLDVDWPGGHSSCSSSIS